MRHFFFFWEDYETHYIMYTLAQITIRPHYDKWGVRGADRYHEWLMSHQKFSQVHNQDLFLWLHKIIKNLLNFYIFKELKRNSILLGL